MRQVHTLMLGFLCAHILVGCGVSGDAPGAHTVVGLLSSGPTNRQTHKSKPTNRPTNQQTHNARPYTLHPTPYTLGSKCWSLTTRPKTPRPRLHALQNKP
jgi:hypothetical protein